LPTTEEQERSLYPEQMLDFRDLCCKRFLKAPPLCTSTPMKSSLVTSGSSADSCTTSPSQNSTGISGSASSEVTEKEYGQTDQTTSTSNQSTSQSARRFDEGFQSDETSSKSCRQSVVRSKASSSFLNREPRIGFTKKEIRAVYRGVAIYGEDWRSIHMAYLTTFHKSRTAQKLYDKWRKQLCRFPDDRSYFERKMKKRTS